jgi:hypothetical protein
VLEDHPREQLCFIVTQYGRTIIDDPRRCRGLLKDLAPNHKRETNLLFLALEEKIVTELAQKNTIIPLPLQLDRLAQRLHDNCGIQLEFAYWSVESWAIALNIIQQPLLKVANSSSTPRSPPLKVTPTVKPIEKKAFKLGEVLPDGGIVFYIDASGSQGLAAKATDENLTLTWYEATREASAYGSGWRLPTKDELNLLYKQKKIVGGFSSSYYWSSTELDSGFPWFQSFDNGDQHNRNIKDYPFSVRSVRAVRAFQQSIPNVFIEPIPTIKHLKSGNYKLGDVLPDGGIVFYIDASGIHGLAAKATDEPSELKWDKAIIAASAYGSGWYLPTQNELNLLFYRRNVVGGFATRSFYWSSTEFGSAWFGTGSACVVGHEEIISPKLTSRKTSKCRVRAVRAF